MHRRLIDTRNSALITRIGLQATHDIAARYPHKHNQCEEKDCEFFAHVFDCLLPHLMFFADMRRWDYIILYQGGQPNGTCGVFAFASLLTLWQSEGIWQQI